MQTFSPNWWYQKVVIPQSIRNWVNFVCFGRQHINQPQLTIPFKINLKVCVEESIAFNKQYHLTNKPVHHLKYP